MVFCVKAIGYKSDEDRVFVTRLIKARIILELDQGWMISLFAFVFFWHRIKSGLIVCIWI